MHMRKLKRKRVGTTIKISDEIYEQLQNLKKRECITISQFVTTALQQALDRYEPLRLRGRASE